MVPIVGFDRIQSQGVMAGVMAGRNNGEALGKSKSAEVRLLYIACLRGSKSIECEQELVDP